jgi:hypothetical protein
VPIDASIPLQGKKPDTFGKLSELLNMQRQSIAVQADKTALASAQQSQRQREGLASFDWAKLSGDDGTIDLNKISSRKSCRRRCRSVNSNLVPNKHCLA